MSRLEGFGDRFTFSSSINWFAGEPYLLVSISNAYLFSNSAEMLQGIFKRAITEKKLELCVVLRNCKIVSSVFLSVLAEAKQLGHQAGVAVRIYADVLPELVRQHPELRGLFEAGSPEEVYVALAASPDARGWLTCPHCSRRFPTYASDCWSGGVHVSCGGRIELTKSGGITSG